MKSGKIIILTMMMVAAVSCTSVWRKKYKDGAGVMYGMIYDANEEGVAAVNVKVDGRLKAVSDGQGRFILQFMFADIRNRKELWIELEKEGYEKVKQEFYYEPMSLLHIRLTSGEELLAEAEDAIERGEYENAERLLERLFEIEGYQDESFFLKAVIRYKEGREEEVKEVLEKIAVKGEVRAIKEFLKRIKK